MACFILNRAKYSSRKIFKPFRFPFSKVKQLKKITLDDSTYTLVGQQTEKSSPFVINYIVYDEKRQIVESKIAKRIYKIMMLALLVEKLKELQPIFLAERSIVEQKGKYLDTYYLGPISKNAYKAWKQLISLFDELKQKQLWSLEDVSHLQQNWKEFWSLYEERASLLVTLRQEKLSKDQGETVNSIDSLIMHEVAIVGELFINEEFDIEADPLDLENWLALHSVRALANEREISIYTRADRQSRKLLILCFYIVMLGLVTPFFIYRSFEDGFAYLFFLFLFFSIYIIFYYVNTYRLKQNMSVRMSELWNKEEYHRLFETWATSVNMGSAPLYVTVATGGMLFAEVRFHGWSGFAFFFLLLVVAVILFSIWFPYSPFVEKDVIIYPNHIRVGYHNYSKQTLWQISVDKHDIVYTFYLTYTKEPYAIHIEQEDRPQMRTIIKQWCEENDIPFTLFDPNDRYLHHTR